MTGGQVAAKKLIKILGGDMFKNIIIAILAIAVIGLGLIALRNSQPCGGVPNASIHTARQYEDGSYRIEYLTGQVVTGCVEGGLCND